MPNGARNVTKQRRRRKISAGGAAAVVSSFKKIRQALHVLPDGQLLGAALLAIAAAGQAEACTGIWAYFRAATGAVLATEL